MAMDAGADTTGQGSGGWSATGTRAAGAGHAAADMPSLHKLAQDWITLWQSELSAMAADPELREAWQAMMAIWAASMSAMLRAMPRAPAPGPHDGSAGEAGATDASRPETAAAAPDTRDAEIERLTRHVATLERRLAELERAERERRSDPAERPKRRSGRKPRG